MIWVLTTSLDSLKSKFVCFTKLAKTMSKKAIFVSDQTLSVNDSLFGLAVYIFEPLASKPVSKQPVSEKMISRDKTRKPPNPSSMISLSSMSEVGHFTPGWWNPIHFYKDSFKNPLQGIEKLGTKIFHERNQLCFVSMETLDPFFFAGGCDEFIPAACSWKKPGLHGCFLFLFVFRGWNYTTQFCRVFSFQ